jgi:hypothetical protein
MQLFGCAFLIICSSHREMDCAQLIFTEQPRAFNNALSLLPLGLNLPANCLKNEISAHLIIPSSTELNEILIGGKCRMPLFLASSFETREFFSLQHNRKCSGIIPLPLIRAK